MPTKHRRHAITETGPVAEALTALREELGSDGFTLPELVVLGAQQRLYQVQIERATRSRGLALIAEEIRSGALPAMDVSAADELRERGWVRGQ